MLFLFLDAFYRYLSGQPRILFFQIEMTLAFIALIFAGIIFILFALGQKSDTP